MTATPTTADLAQFGAAVVACLVFADSWNGELATTIGDVAHRYLGIDGPGPSAEEAEAAREIARRYGIDTADLGDNTPSLTFTGQLDPARISAIETARASLHDITRAEGSDRAEVSDLLDATRDYLELVEAYAGIRTK